jgi:hypothetical protein
MHADQPMKITAAPGSTPTAVEALRGQRLDGLRLCLQTPSACK